MEFNGVRCDVCGTLKQETNHWLVAITSVAFSGIMFQMVESVESPHAGDFQYEDICGQNCMHKRLSRWLESQTPTAAPVPLESVTA